MVSKFRGKFGRERPTDPVRVVANRLFARHEAELMAQLQSFVQEQLQRPVSSASSQAEANIIEGEIRVIEVYSASCEQIQPLHPDKAATVTRTVEAEFRAWQAEVFELEIGGDNDTIIENYLGRVMIDGPEQDSD